MSGPTTHKRQIGNSVLIQEINWECTPPWPGQIESLSAHQFCATCHCTPSDPDHHGDGSLCCPGPWYTVAFTCSDCQDHHIRVFAEHELLDAP